VNYKRVNETMPKLYDREFEQKHIHLNNCYVSKFSLTIVDAQILIICIFSKNITRDIRSNLININAYISKGTFISLCYVGDQKENKPRVLPHDLLYRNLCIGLNRMHNNYAVVLLVAHPSKNL
jgi:hypothetical protein